MEYMDALELTEKHKLIQCLNYEIETINGQLQTVGNDYNFKKKYYSILKEHKQKLFEFRQSLSNDIDIELSVIKDNLFHDIKG